MQKYYSAAHVSEELLMVNRKFYNTEEAKKGYLRAKKRELLWLTAKVRLRTS